MLDFDSLRGAPPDRFRPCSGCRFSTVIASQCAHWRGNPFLSCAPCRRGGHRPSSFAAGTKPSKALTNTTMTAHELTGGSAALGSPSERAHTISPKACHPERSARVVEGPTHLPSVTGFVQWGKCQDPSTSFYSGRDDIPWQSMRRVSPCAFRYISPFLIRHGYRRATFPPGEGFAACRRWQWRDCYSGDYPTPLGDTRFDTWLDTRGNGLSRQCAHWLTMTTDN